jgi:hypothetical protein
MFSYDKHEAHKKIKRAKIYYRALVRYPQITQLPCGIKGCIHKKRNGRCGLKECRLELDEKDNLTGICLCYQKRGTP